MSDTMKPLQEHAGLFANGKFKVALKLDEEFSFINLKIEMYDALTNMYYLSDISGWHKIEECTLIARKIEDMTDEEIESCKRVYETLGYKDHVGGIQFLKDKANGVGLNINDALYLLSIGVYPFSDTKDVIFKPKP